MVFYNTKKSLKTLHTSNFLFKKTTTNSSFHFAIFDIVLKILCVRNDIIMLLYDIFAVGTQKSVCMGCMVCMFFLDMSGWDGLVTLKHRSVEN